MSRVRECCAVLCKVPSNVWCMSIRAGNYGAAGVGWTFTYAVASPETGNATQVVQVPPLPYPSPPPPTSL